jgi:ribosomal protein S27AE
VTVQEKNLCDCCHDEPAVGVASIPYIAMSIAWGSKCLEAGVIPYWAAVANTVACAGFEETSGDWQELVRLTLDYFGKSMDDFLAEVARDMEEMDFDMARQEEELEPTSFTCPRCGMTSHSPTDIAEGYCGKCFDWTRQ